MKFPSNITTEIRNFVTSFMLKRRFYILKTTVENRHLHIGETSPRTCGKREPLITINKIILL